MKKDCEYLKLVLWFVGHFCAHLLQPVAVHTGTCYRKKNGKSWIIRTGIIRTLLMSYFFVTDRDIHFKPSSLSPFHSHTKSKFGEKGSISTAVQTLASSTVGRKSSLCRPSWHRGSGCIAPLIFHLGNRYWAVVIFTPWPLCKIQNFVEICPVTAELLHV